MNFERDISPKHHMSVELRKRELAEYEIEENAESNPPNYSYRGYFLHPTPFFYLDAYPR